MNSANVCGHESSNRPWKGLPVSCQDYDKLKQLTVTEQEIPGFLKGQCLGVPDRSVLLSGDASGNCSYELNNGSGHTIGERSDHWLSVMQNGTPIHLSGTGEVSVLCS